jgi:hypothetical protein
MLQEIDLDQEQFWEIVERARAQMRAKCPAWTDENPHDPGITLLELFAWQKEVLQYRMNQDSISMTAAFFKLLGIQRKHRRAATTRILVQVQKDLILPNKTRFFAKEMCFETLERRKLTACSIHACIFMQGGSRRLVSIEAKQDWMPLQEPLFGANPRTGNSFTVVFAIPVWVEDVLRIGFTLREAPGYRRSTPLDSSFLPLGEFDVAYCSEETLHCETQEGDAEKTRDWLKLDIKRDDTYGFLFDGEIMLAPKEPGVWIREVRFTLTRDGYEVPPVLTGLHPNVLPLRQQVTRIECRDFVFGKESPRNPLSVTSQTWLSLFGNEIVLVGKAGRYRRVAYTKTPDYIHMTCTYQIDRNAPENEIGDDADTVKVISFDPVPVFYADSANADVDQLGGICAAVADGLPGQGYRIEDGIIPEELSMMLLEEDNTFYVWERKEDFFSSGAQDRHFIFEEAGKGEEGLLTLRFGNGTRGKNPKGLIVCTSYVCSFGSFGNVKAGTLSDATIWGEVVAIQQDIPATGGRAEESNASALARFVRELRDDHTLVTAQDYENAVHNTPGVLIDRCRVLEWKDGILRMVVRPGSVDESIRFREAFAQNILRYLNRRRMIGVHIILEPPVYVNLDITCQIVLYAEGLAKTKVIEDAIRAYFRERRKELGKPLFHREIALFLEKNPVVKEVRHLELDVTDDRIACNANGDVLFAPNQIAKVDKIHIHTSY